MTYFVAMPFVRADNGELVAGEAQERQSAGAAESGAPHVRNSSQRRGLLAHWRPATGEFTDAVVLRQFGEVPSLEDLLSAG